MTREFLTHSADETIALGRQLAPLIRDARIVLLRGDLGAGKTTLVKGIAEAFKPLAGRCDESNIYVGARIPRT